MAEEIRIQEHSSPIQTPKQLLVVVLAAFAVPIALIVMIAHLVTSSSPYGKDHPAMSEQAIAQRIKPVGEVVVVDASAPRVEKSGKEVVEAVCAACHATGALQAPRIGDKAAWAKLIKEGLDSLTRTSVKGIRQMPPRGGNPDLTDLEIARAIVYMANQAGANWKEPAPKTAAGPTAAAAAPAAAGAAPAPAPVTVAKAEPAKGKAVYDANCTACHATGVAGAPRTGDKAAWAPRLKAGMEALYTASLKGKNAMPPKGGNLALADADVKAAVDYMVGLVR
jgi:cytochrome c5